MSIDKSYDNDLAMAKAGPAMTAPLDEKGLLRAMSEFVTHRGNGSYSVMGEHMARCALDAINAAGFAIVAASPSPSMEMEVVAWQVPAMSATYGQTGWKFINRQQNPDDYEPGEYEALQESLATTIPLVTLSQAQSAIAAMRAERDEALAKWEKADGMDGAVVDAIRQLLHAQNVPLSAFIDDHVANAIRQRNDAQAQVLRLTEENKALRKDAERDNKIISDLQGALAYWMPSVRPDTDEGLPRSAGDDAQLLFGHEGPEQGCWGDDMLARIKALEEALIPLAAITEVPALGYVTKEMVISARSALKENAQ